MKEFIVAFIIVLTFLSPLLITEFSGFYIFIAACFAAPILIGCE